MNGLAQGLLMMLPEMLNNDERTHRVRAEMVVEMRDDYIEARNKYLETIPEEYRITAKRDKDKLFEYAAMRFVYDPKGIPYNTLLDEWAARDIDYEKRRKEMFDIVFKAEANVPWIWEEERSE